MPAQCRIRFRPRSFRKLPRPSASLCCPHVRVRSGQLPRTLSQMIRAWRLLQSFCESACNVGSWGHRLRPNRGLGSMSGKGRALSPNWSFHNSFRKKHASLQTLLRASVHGAKHVSERISGIISVSNTSRDNGQNKTVAQMAEAVASVCNQLAEVNLQGMLEPEKPGLSLPNHTWLATATHVEATKHCLLQRLHLSDFAKRHT